MADDIEAQEPLGEEDIQGNALDGQENAEIPEGVEGLEGAEGQPLNAQGVEIEQGANAQNAQNQGDALAGAQRAAAQANNQNAQPPQSVQDDGVADEVARRAAQQNQQQNLDQVETDVVDGQPQEFAQDFSQEADDSWGMDDYDQWDATSYDYEQDFSDNAWMDSYSAEFSDPGDIFGGQYADEWVDYGAAPLEYNNNYYDSPIGDNWGGATNSISMGMEAYAYEGMTNDAYGYEGMDNDWGYFDGGMDPTAGFDSTFNDFFDMHDGYMMDDAFYYDSKDPMSMDYDPLSAGYDFYSDEQWAADSQWLMDDPIFETMDFDAMPELDWGMASGDSFYDPYTGEMYEDPGADAYMKDTGHMEPGYEMYGDAQDPYGMVAEDYSKYDTDYSKYDGYDLNMTDSSVGYEADWGMDAGFFDYNADFVDYGIDFSGMDSFYSDPYYDPSYDTMYDSGSAYMMDDYWSSDVMMDASYGFDVNDPYAYDYHYDPGLYDYGYDYDATVDYSYVEYDATAYYDDYEYYEEYVPPGGTTDTGGPVGDSLVNIYEGSGTGTAEADLFLDTDSAGDTMTGGGGADTFYLGEGGTSDSITDFQSGEDQIALSADGFSAVGASGGTLTYNTAADTFSVTGQTLTSLGEDLTEVAEGYTGSITQGEGDHFIFDDAGQLWYDSDLTDTESASDGSVQESDDLTLVVNLDEAATITTDDIVFVEPPTSV